MTDISQVSGAGGIAASSGAGPSKEIMDEYNRLMNEIRKIYEKTTPTEEDQKNLEKALDELKKLQGSNNFSDEMVKQLNSVITLLDAAGIKKGGSFADFQEGLKILKDKDATIDPTKDVKFSTILEMASGKAAEKGLQAMLYYDLFRSADATYQAKLKGFKEQLETLKEIMTTLNELQEYRNKSTGKPTDKGPQGNNPNGPPPDPLALLDLQKKLEEQVNKLKGLIEKAVPPGNTGPGSAVDALQKVVKDIKDIFEPLYAEAKKFYDKLGQPVDMKKVAEMTAKKWMSDNQGTRDKGTFQDNLNKAFGAVQSFNESQTGVLQDIKLNYEEIVKIVNALLDAINKILEKSASNLSRDR